MNPSSLAFGGLALAFCAGSPVEQDPVAPDAAYRSYLAHVAAAEACLRLGETGAARRWIDAAPPAEHGFEWRWLDARADASLRALDFEREPYAIALAPDGLRVAVGTPQGGVAIHDLVTGAELVRMDGHAEATLAVDFDVTGERVVSSSYDRTAKVWDAASGALLVDFERHGYPVGGVAFSPDGRFVASSSYERPLERGVVGTVHVWESATGDLVRTFEGGRKPLVDVRFAPDGATLAAASWDFCVVLFDLAGTAPMRTLAMPDEGLYNAVDDVAFSPDARSVAAVSKDMTARVWDVATGELRLTLRGHANDVTSVAFAPGSALLATGSADQGVRLWSTADGSARGLLRGHTGGVDDVAFAADGTLWSSSADGTLRAWDVTGEPDGVVRRTSAACYAAAFSPDGTRVATCSYDGRFQLWSASTSDLLASRQAHPSERSCHTLAWTSDSERLVTGSYDGTAALWDAVTLEEIARLEHPEGLAFLALAHDGRTLATTQPKAVWLWDLERLEHVATVEALGSSTVDLAFDATGTRLAIANRDRSVRIVDAASGAELARHELDAEPKAVAFAPDGSELAIAVGNQLRFVDALGGRERARATAGDNELARLAWSRDGARIACSSAFVPIVDPRTAECVVILRPHAESGWHLSWSPDGTQLASAGMDGTLAIADSLPARERIARRTVALAERATALARVDAALGAGRSPAEAWRELGAQQSGAQRVALRDAITLRAGTTDDPRPAGQR